MRIALSSTVASIVALLLLLAGNAPASAASAQVLVQKPALGQTQAMVEKVGWRRGWRHRGFYGYRRPWPHYRHYRYGYYPPVYGYYYRPYYRPFGFGLGWGRGWHHRW